MQPFFNIPLIAHIFLANLHCKAVVWFFCTKVESCKCTGGSSCRYYNAKKRESLKHKPLCFHNKRQDRRHGQWRTVTLDILAFTGWLDKNLTLPRGDCQIPHFSTSSNIDPIPKIFLVVQYWTALKKIPPPKAQTSSTWAGCECTLLFRRLPERFLWDQNGKIDPPRAHMVAYRRQSASPLDSPCSRRWQSCVTCANSIGIARRSCSAYANWQSQKSK